MRQYFLKGITMLLFLHGFQGFAEEVLHPCGLKFSDPRQNRNLIQVSSLTLKAGPTALPITTDLSSQMPPVGNQGSQGSCVGWAMGYYHKTHTEWIEHGWDIKLPQNQCSPAFLYHLMNGGSDNGAYFDDATKIIVDNGVATMSLMPYSQSDYTTWPSESAFEGALQFRGMTANYVSVADDNGLNIIKTQLANGLTAVLGISVYGNFDNISTYKNTYCVANITGSNRGGHAVTFVGYDDTMTTDDGKGAFKMVNSWGTGWGKSGYWWMSYQAVENGTLSQLSAYYVTDRTAYTPLLIARAQVTHAARTRVGIQFGFGPTSTPRGTKDFFSLMMPTNTNRAFPGSNMVFDLTDNMASIGSDSLMFLRCLDKASDGNTGTINYFSAQLGATSKVSIDPPVSIPDYNTAVYATLKLQTITGKHLSAAPDSLRFGTVWVGGNSGLKLTFTNIGNDTTTISACALSKAVFSHNGALPLKVPPYGSSTIVVTFAPSSVGTVTDTLKITSNAIDNPSLKISLKGTGATPPTIAVSPSSICDTLTSGDSATNGTVIKNTAAAGSGNLLFTINPVSKSWLTFSPASGTIAPGDSARISVKFKATSMAGGLYYSPFAIGHNASNAPTPISVPCTLAVQGIKRLAALPVSLEFGTLWVADDSAMTITLSNSGSDTTTISAATLRNSVFTHNMTAPLRVFPFSSTTLRVIFKPDSIKDEFDTLRLVSNADDNPNIAISLHGRGATGPTIVIAPGSLKRSVNLGDSATASIRISNSGGDTLRGSILATVSAMPVSSSVWKGDQQWNTRQTPETGWGIPSAVLDKSGFPVTAVVTYPFSDGFENGSYSTNWTTGGGSYVRAVTNTTAATGTYSFTQTGGSSSNFNGVSASFSTGQRPSTISFAVRAASTAANGSYVVLCGGNGSQTQILWFYMTDAGYLYMNANATVPYQANTWYTVSLFLNWTNYTFDYYVNGQSIAKNIAFRNAVPITDVYLHNYSNTQGWWDDIKLGDAQPIWLSASPTSILVAPNDSSDIAVKMNALTLSAGNFFGNLAISHNAPATTSPANIPCTLTVIGTTLPTVAFETASQTIQENAGTVTVRAFLSWPYAGDVSVPFTVSGAASNPADHNLTNGTITIKAGAMKDSVLFQVVNDQLHENDETVVLTMATPVNAGLGAPSVHTVTIVDDDPAPAVQFTSASQSAPEDAGVMTVTARLSSPSALTVTLPFTVSGTATGGGVDYSITASPITIPAGSTTGGVAITVIDDTLQEPDETVVIAMGSPTNASLGAITTHTATIVDNDFNGAIKVKGLDSAARVFLYAAGGWLGVKQFNGNGTLMLAPGAYRAAVVQKNMRTEYLLITSRRGVRDSVTIQMHGAVPMAMDTLKKVTYADGSAISIGSPGLAVMEDMDRDGDEDLVTLSRLGVLSLYDNNIGLQSPQNFSLGLAAGVEARSLRIVDIDADNRFEYLVGLSTGEIVTYKNPPTIPTKLYTASSGLTGVELCDLNGDNKLDLLVGYADGTFDYIASNDTGGFVPAVRLTGSSATPLSVVADASPMCLTLDGDSLPDLVAGNKNGDIAWFKRKADGTYSTQGPLNAMGTAIKVSGQAGIAFGYRGAGQLPKMLVTDNNGFVYQSNAGLTGDFDGDGTVGFSDYMLLVNAWNTTEGDASYSRKANMVLSSPGPQKIDFYDYMYFISVWNKDLKN